MTRAHPTNPNAFWAERADGKGFHWTLTPPATAKETAPTPAKARAARKAG
jgi:hypothetical protein